MIVALPNEIWCIILKFAFPRIETDIETLKASFKVRATSVDFLECVNRYLLGDVKSLAMIDREFVIPSSSLPLFTGVTKLCQLELPQLNDETLACMPWIKELDVRNDILNLYEDEEDCPSKVTLTECGLSSLTSLEILSIHEPTINQVHALSTLVNLNSLDLWFNHSVCDKELPRLSSLTHLQLHHDRLIDGVCFTENKMPRLKRLIISGTSSNLAMCYLDHLAPQLEMLALWDCNVMVPSTLKRMTNLKELALIRTKVDYNEGIESLISLRGMTLCDVDLRDQTFMHLTRLSDLCIAHSDTITPKSLAYLAASLKSISLIECPLITPSDLLCCTELREFKYIADRDATIRDLEALRVLLDRGAVCINDTDNDIL